jgi:hypothetical protein
VAAQPTFIFLSSSSHVRVSRELTVSRIPGEGRRRGGVGGTTVVEIEKKVVAKPGV